MLHYPILNQRIEKQKVINNSVSMSNNCWTKYLNLLSTFAATIHH